ncbi:MAG TPA: hypothetical protein ENI26_02110 [Methylophaga aminisulfidivorans]|nr:hypothetical protein [Methylophaga aminisulfidivorans]
MGQVLVSIDLPHFITDRDERDSSIDVVVEHLLKGDTVSDAYDEIRYNRRDVFDALDLINPAVVYSLICLPALGEDVSSMKPQIMIAAKKVAAEIVDSYLERAEEENQPDYSEYFNAGLLERRAS